MERISAGGLHEAKIDGLGAWWRMITAGGTRPFLGVALQGLIIHTVARGGYTHDD
jgi:hypothetical protein